MGLFCPPWDVKQEAGDSRRPCWQPFYDQEGTIQDEVEAVMAKGRVEGAGDLPAPLTPERSPTSGLPALRWDECLPRPSAKAGICPGSTWAPQGGGAAAVETALRPRQVALLLHQDPRVATQAHQEGQT